MDKLAVAGVDAHVGGALAGVAAVEEHQIAGLQLALGDGGAVVHLAGGGAVDGVAEVLHHIGGKAGAVKAAGAAAAVHIGAAHILKGILGDLAPLTGGGRHRGVHLSHIVAAHIALLDLVPAAVAADQLLDLHDGAGGEAAHGAVLGTRAGADVQGAVHHLAVELLLRHLEVVAAHVAGHAVICNLVPGAVVRGAEHIHLSAVIQGRQDRGVGAGLRAEVQAGIAGHRTDVGGHGRDDHGGQGHQSGTQLGRQLLRQVHNRIPPISLS